MDIFLYLEVNFILYNMEKLHDVMALSENNLYILLDDV